MCIPFADALTIVDHYSLGWYASDCLLRVRAFFYFILIILHSSYIAYGTSAIFSTTFMASKCARPRRQHTNALLYNNESHINTGIRQLMHEMSCSPDQLHSPLPPSTTRSDTHPANS